MKQPVTVPYVVQGFPPNAQIASKTFEWEKSRVALSRISRITSKNYIFRLTQNVGLFVT